MNGDHAMLLEKLHIFGRIRTGLSGDAQTLNIRGEDVSGFWYVK